MSGSLLLVGPMGAGKTTIGRRLAHELGWEFFDSDTEIEQRTGADIPLIFEKEGEAGFRTREKAVIHDLCAHRNVVIATGGGAVTTEENRRELRKAGFVVYLQTSVEDQLRRTSRDANRPLLNNNDRRTTLENLIRVRDPLYRDVADLCISTAGDRMNRVTKSILNAFRQECGSFSGQADSHSAQN